MDHRIHMSSLYGTPLTLSRMIEIRVNERQVTARWNGPLPNTNKRIWIQHGVKVSSCVFQTLILKKWMAPCCMWLWWITTPHHRTIQCPPSRWICKSWLRFNTKTKWKRRCRLIALCWNMAMSWGVFNVQFMFNAEEISIYIEARRKKAFSLGWRNVWGRNNLKGYFPWGVFSSLFSKTSQRTHIHACTQLRVENYTYAELLLDRLDKCIIVYRAANIFKVLWRYPRQSVQRRVSGIAELSVLAHWSQRQWCPHGITALATTRSWHTTQSAWTLLPLLFMVFGQSSSYFLRLSGGIPSRDARRERILPSRWASNSLMLFTSSCSRSSRITSSAVALSISAISRSNLSCSARSRASCSTRSRSSRSRASCSALSCSSLSRASRSASSRRIRSWYSRISRERLFCRWRWSWKKRPRALSSSTRPHQQCYW